eukprot:15352935-Ditylum_brightwellii.AAC.1
MQLSGIMRRSSLVALAIRRPLSTRVFPRGKTQALTANVAQQNHVFLTPSSSSLFSTSSSFMSSKRNDDPNAVFVVNGSSRGIGLQFVKSLLDRSQGTILACCRSPDSAHKLNEYISSLSPLVSPRVKVLQLDVEDQASIDTLANEIKTSFNNRVDCLFNVAGLLGDGQTTPGPERSLSKLNREWVEKTMAVNVIGPVMLSQALAPMMVSKKRGRKSTEDDERAQTVIVNLSARVGSISDNELGG